MQGRAVTPATHAEAVHQKIKSTYLCMCVFGVSEGEKERERNRGGGEGEVGKEERRNARWQNVNDWPATVIYGSSLYYSLQFCCRLESAE